MLIMLYESKKINKTQTRLVKKIKIKYLPNLYCRIYSVDINKKEFLVKLFSFGKNELCPDTIVLYNSLTKLRPVAFDRNLTLVRITIICTCIIIIQLILQ